MSWSFYNMYSDWSLRLVDVPFIFKVHEHKNTCNTPKWAFPEKIRTPPVEDIPFLIHRPPGYPPIFSNTPLDIRGFF